MRLFQDREARYYTGDIKPERFDTLVDSFRFCLQTKKVLFILSLNPNYEAYLAFNLPAPKIQDHFRRSGYAEGSRSLTH